MKRIEKTEIPSTDQARRLIQLLPASLEELVLCSTHSDASWTNDASFLNAPTLRSQRVPHLNKIVFEGITPLQSLVKFWKSVGVQMYWQSPFPMPKSA